MENKFKVIDWLRKIRDENSAKPLEAKSTSEETEFFMAFIKAHPETTGPRNRRMMKNAGVADQAGYLP